MNEEPELLYDQSMENILDVAEYEFHIGIDGLPYIVFGESDNAYAYQESFGGMISHFGKYENSVSLSSTLGMDGVQL